MSQVALPAPEPALESIDLEEIEVPPHRRSGPGVAGTRLQPAEIAATLALAAAAAQPARATATVPEVAPFAEPAPKPVAVPEAAAYSAATTTSAPAFEPQIVTPAPAPVAPEPAPSAAALPVSAPAAPVQAAVAAVPAPGPETYVAAALHAQHLQHQLALSEMRNQHLLEQQQMLREMLAMARQAMV
ncbi:hypothetical protein [Hymenobacter arizonensis]|nr:hypothetical protein [Hymenobacter arizonensis]